MRDDRRQTHRESLQTKAAYKRQVAAQARAEEEVKVKKETALASSMKKGPTKSSHGPWLDSIFKIAPRLEERTYFEALNILQCMTHVRTISTWKPKGKGRDTLFMDLCSHLLATYPMPNFLWSALFEDDARNLTQFVSHVAVGGSVADAIKKGLLPVPLTRKMCHDLMQTTSEFTFLSAVRRIQVKTLGGSERLFRVWAQHRVAKRLQDPIGEAFWMKVIEWFSKWSMVDMNQVGPMVDYIIHKFNADPSFSMKGRTALSVLRDATVWHSELAKVKPKNVATFRPSGFKPYETTKRVKDNWGSIVEQQWTFTELLSSKDLADEGRALNHCVYSYSHYVEKGYTSIWSLSVDGIKAITLEVNNQNRKIVQARGKFNRAMTSHEMVVVQEWANQNSLQISLGRW